MAAPSVRAFCVPPAASLREAVEAMDAGGLGIALVTDEAGRLLGTVTDGDMRRGLLHGARLEEPVQRVMHAHPTTVKPGGPREELLHLMQQCHVEHLPIVDEAGVVVGLESLSQLLEQPQAKATVAVIVAGGLGTRLRPLTNETPKTLLKVGDRPLAEVLIEQLAGYGFRNLIAIVNHQADVIERHLGDGAALGVRMRYIREQTPLGTAGGLRLAAPHLTNPFIVVNGDVLTRVNFEHLVGFHERQGFDITLGVKDYDVQIPYGVVQLSDGLVCRLDEKPSQRFFVNGGIYVLNASVVELIPEGQAYDMTDLIQAALRHGRRVGGFPIHEYWLDIGRSDDYARAQMQVKSWNAASAEPPQVQPSLGEPR